MYKTLSKKTYDSFDIPSGIDNVFFTLVNDYSAKYEHSNVAPLLQYKILSCTYRPHVSTSKTRFISVFLREIFKSIQLGKSR